MKNILATASLIAAAIIAFPAQAVTVDFKYTNTNVNNGDQSGKTSPLLGANNVAAPNSGLFVETFSGKGGVANSQGCGLDTPAGLISITGGSYGFRQGTLPGIAAAPAGDSTCFAYGPGAGQTSSTVNIDYTKLLAGFGNATLNYLGLYYGSIDTFNDLIFYNAAHQVIRTVTGTELINQFAGQSGNQTADSSNIYVNLYFDPSEQFTSFSFRTTSIAFEMDNLAVGINIAPPTGVPEPASIALLGLGLAALGVTRRRKNAA